MIWPVPAPMLSSKRCAGLLAAGATGAIGAGLLGAGLLAASLLAVALPARATPLLPQSDSQVIERLPPQTRVSSSRDPLVAAAEARDLIQASRREGDPRPAGRALARLAPWAGADQAPTAPAPVLLALAEAEQYLHEFNRAVLRLQGLVQREPGLAQAWLLLATLHRVQGRYDLSDQACESLRQLRVQPYADACLAENGALRGDLASARPMLQRLLQAQAAPATRAWLGATLAELEERAGQPDAADAAWRQSLREAPDTYTAVAYADFLLDRQRPQPAWDLLAPLPRSEPVLLRQAIAAARLGRPEAAALRTELHERHAQADLRPGDSGHLRERALRALDIDKLPRLALAQARKNLQRQREPIDLWLMARAAQAAGDPQALAEVQRLARQQGLQDARLATP